MTEDNPISTITEFLEATGARLRIFDMGRRITKITRDQFLQFEKNELPYPYPMQQQGWFALLFQDDKREIEPFIWFLRFPLDEQGKLLQAARDDFMHRLVERVSENLQATESSEKLDAVLKDNPYTFKPRDDRMAVFHAQATRPLKQPPSQYFEHAKQYFSGELGLDQWSFVGYQGIAEIASLQADKEIEQMLVTTIPELPDRPLEALCHCLENEPLTMAVTRAVWERMKRLLSEPDPNVMLVAACIRAVSCSQSHNLKQELISTALAHDSATKVELLAAISGRAWEILQDETIRRQYLERLAENNEGQEFFNQCLSDLLFLPGMRAPLLGALRDPERSERLSQAIGALFQRIQNQ
ncbi:DUF3549 family protein [Solemya velesiana gill symbiont]|uniref:DUF3549 domain-containing protein n=1 Tax=Solemya velesiana gill symbiont TaxID=1918948 RepID=A0A1T2KS15_9GAMM|nr:DUF3549 family protein [Solemya velesiana gill symbiont]OOZ35653.1 hypothetical protein BOW51_10995 [Solemya velesiana gill symbiont]